MKNWLQLGCILSALGLLSCSQMQSFDYVDNRETPPGPGLFTGADTIFNIGLDNLSATGKEESP